MPPSGGSPNEPLLFGRNYMRVPPAEQSTLSVLDTSQEPVSDGSGVPGKYFANSSA